MLNGAECYTRASREFWVTYQVNSPVPQLPLRDIHLPDSIGWWPLAPGWWIVGVLLLASGFLIIIFARYMKAKNRIRRISLKEIDLIQQSFVLHKDRTRVVCELSVLLRQACISRYSRMEVASLTGAGWMSFLDRNLDGRPFSDGVGKIFMTGPYQKSVEINVDLLLDLCRNWIAALPSKKS